MFVDMQKYIYFVSLFNTTLILNTNFKKLPQTKNVLFFLLQAPTHDSFTLSYNS